MGATDVGGEAVVGGLVADVLVTGACVVVVARLVEVVLPDAFFLAFDELLPHAARANARARTTPTLAKQEPTRHR